MSRAKGTANLAASLEVLAGAPLDAREKVPTKADLYLASNFPYPYVGLETYVVSENKKYRLIGNDVTVTANWEEVGSGGGGGTTVVVNPEGEATDELEKLQVGNDIYSIPEENVEISKAQFDALPAATKNNGKAYYIPDANILTNFTVMGNRFDKANIYDTTERMVGRWIDGKPIYQLTFKVTNISSSSRTYKDILDATNLNIEHLIFGYGWYSGSGDVENTLYRIIPSGDTNTGFGVCYRKNTKKIQAVLNGSIESPSNCYGYVTIQYTKTTDASVAVGTENDYSTDEMIIGTWIDGKPMYQKTFNSLSISLSSATATSYATSQFDALLTDIKPIKCQITGVNGGYVTCEDACIRTMANNKWILYANNDMTINELTIQYTKTTD